MDKITPLYELKINPEQGFDVNFISLVRDPAVESSFMAFSKTPTPVQRVNFSADNERRELLGLAMNPDVNIPRVDNDGFEYFVKFSKETVREVALTFAQKGYNQNTNLEHSQIPAHSVVWQSYIVDEEKGIYAPKGITNTVDGAWIVGMKITDDRVWNLIKNGTVKGFSVEGYFQQQLDDFLDIKMSKEDKFLQALQMLEVELDAYLTSMKTA